MLDVRFTQLTDPGKTRHHNEDYLGHVAPANAADVSARGWLFALADGVGGQEAGEVASQAAIERITTGFRSADDNQPHAPLLRRLIQSANERVYSLGRSAGAGGMSMATTLVVCALRSDRATVAHVGDSRCYLIRNAEATQLTRDHTVVAEQVRLGILSAKEASEATTRNVLSRSLGNDLIVSVEINEHPILNDDVLVLCSDGLHNSVSDHDLAHTLGSPVDLDQAARHLVDVANQRDGGDNISVQLIHIRSVERTGMYRGRPYRLPST